MSCRFNECVADEQLPSTSEELGAEVEPQEAETILSDGRIPVTMSMEHQKAHPHHLPTGSGEVLTFYPTMEEFRDFQGYIEKIEKAGGHLKSGIAKVVPPEGWHPRPSRENKNDYSDIDDYEIINPVKETIDGQNGIFYKSNRVFKKKMSVKEFRETANSEEYQNPKPNLEGLELEKEYFKNILVGEPIYGADTEGTLYEEGVEEFNMNRLGTILDETKSTSKSKIAPIIGVNTVYLYFGMYKTTFPWHSEDMDLYSINYLHFGAPKYWFAISSDSAAKFERMVHQQFAPQGVTCKAFLRHKSYVVTPELLRAHNIQYSTMIQRPNEFIITFPKGYHMGFNTGYNLAESTNFATDRWIDYGKNAALCKCDEGMVEIDMRPFMLKYRRSEYDQWHNYWYGNCLAVSRTAKKTKKVLSGKRAGGALTNCSKRACLGADEEGVMSCGLISEGSSASNSSSASPSSKDNVPKQIFAAFMNSAKYDTSKATARQTDVESLQRQFHNITKDVLSSYHDMHAERQKNELDGACWPHCDVCSFFQPAHMRPRCDRIPESSRRLVGSLQFAKNDIEAKNTEEEAESSQLLTCENCHVTVHSACYSGEAPKSSSSLEWKCFRCRPDQSELEIECASCVLCELRGGALIPCDIGTDRNFVHVSCAMLNRRAMFDKIVGPTFCTIDAPPKQRSVERAIVQMPAAYTQEFGDIYETSQWECQVCQLPREGLVPCVLCVQESNNVSNITMAHVTCGKQVGYLFETRQFPKCAVMICDKHMDSHLENRASTHFPHIKYGDGVLALDDDERIEKGVVQAVRQKQFAVVDFLDSSVTRDLPPSMILSCECVGCDGFEHQYGARVKVKWEEDGFVYDGYFRGIVSTPEYKIRFENGCVSDVPRDDILSKNDK